MSIHQSMNLKYAVLGKESCTEDCKLAITSITVRATITLSIKIKDKSPVFIPKSAKSNIPVREVVDRKEQRHVSR